MTDQDESRPLSRREIRLREMAAAGTATEAAPVSDDTAALEAVTAQALSEIDIPLFDETGRQRSRRELRVLREQALAEREAAQQVAAPEPEPASEPAPELESEPEPASEPAPELESDLAAESAASGGSEATPEAHEPHDVEAPAAPPVGQGYSFPDIAPLDKMHSVFDDPALRVMNAQAPQRDFENNAGRDFDDLITRAVAQEGVASATSTSALILPSMPEGDGVAGPLGETGELFVTGSFELPKSLSETGGHATLQDSVMAEPFDALGLAEATPTGSMAPVSASATVSARSERGPLISEPAKDKSKMPVILITVGGVLVLGAAGLIVWAAASGVFG